MADESKQTRPDGESEESTEWPDSARSCTRTNGKTTGMPPDLNSATIRYYTPTAVHTIDQTFGSKTVSNSVRASRTTEFFLDPLESAIDGVLRPRPPLRIPHDLSAWVTFDSATTDFRCSLCQKNTRS